MLKDGRRAARQAAFWSRLRILGFAAAAASSWAQNPSAPTSVVIADAEQRIFKSAVTGSEYQIDIALPYHYIPLDGRPNQKRYPVVYTLDGNVYFPLLADAARILFGQGLIRNELIVVGIGYPGKTSPSAFLDDSYGRSRSHDYTTRASERFIEGSPKRRGLSGGAPAFLRFLTEELIPYIDSTYRTTPSERTLVGHSLGGLFAVYVLTHLPETFRNYAIGSPSLFWDNEAPLQWESDYAANHKDLPARVYLYFGGMESDIMSEPPQQLWDRLKGRHYKSLDLVDSVRAADETHLSVNLSSIPRALRAFYGPKPASVSPETLERYAGTWIDDTGRAWKIRVRDDRLLLEPPEPSTGPRELVAHSETSFGATLVEVGDFGGFSLIFTVDPSRKVATKLVLVRQIHLEGSEVREQRTYILHKAQ